jgi:hypothetical protein
MNIQVTQEPVFNLNSGQLFAVNIFVKFLSNIIINRGVYILSSCLHNLRQEEGQNITTPPTQIRIAQQICLSTLMNICMHEVSSIDSIAKNNLLLF